MSADLPGADVPPSHEYAAPAAERRRANRKRALLSAAIVAVVGAIALYLVLLLLRAGALVSDGGAFGWALGLALVLLVAVGGWTVWRELRFGVRTQRLGRRLDDEGGLPADLPRAENGRPDPHAVAAFFDACKAEAEARPDDWRVWFRLAVAYDLSGDRRRARESMRHAVDLPEVPPQHP